MLSFFILFILGMAVFFLPIREYDYLRLRYIVGLWFFAEAAYGLITSDRMATPLYQLVGRFTTWRDKVVGGAALAAFFVILYCAVRYLMENEFTWVVKLTLAVAVILTTWLVYYGICFLFGTNELRNGILPKFVRRWFTRPDKRLRK